MAKEFIKVPFEKFDYLTRVSQIKNLSKSRSTLGLMLFKNLY